MHFVLLSCFRVNVLISTCLKCCNADIFVTSCGKHQDSQCCFEIELVIEFRRRERKSLCFNDGFNPDLHSCRMKSTSLLRTTMLHEQHMRFVPLYVVFERENISSLSITQSIHTYHLHHSNATSFARIRLECYEILNSRFALEHRYRTSFVVFSSNSRNPHNKMRLVSLREQLCRHLKSHRRS